MPRRFGMLPNEWPAADRAAWERAVIAHGPFDSAAPASHWREKTRTQVRYAYGRWLTYLSNLDPNLLDQPAQDRMTPDTLRSYVRWCEGRLKAMSIAAELQHLLLALRAISSEGDWAWVRKLQYVYAKRAHKREVRDKIIDPRRLLRLGEELMDAAARMEDGREGARVYRDGLLIALLATRPLRRRSVAALTVGGHLHQTASGYVMELTASDTKSGKPVEFTLPDFLGPRIDIYLAQYRHRFPRAAASDALWLSSKGGPLMADAIYRMVCKRTRTAFGVPIHPHLFRDIAVTAIAREAPEALTVARDLLTHANVETTQQFYSRAQTIDAAQRHAEILERLRMGAHLPSAVK